MFKNYFERRKGLQKIFKEYTNRETYIYEIDSLLKMHRELILPVRVLLIVVCILVIIYACKC